ncbi:probable strigolactone esterase DAD2 [Cornus florida]|uniref:probable strigolactone esterase DAD2 n=1 Tax=Cornus florida TaxID=4283 RepID=UPI0028A14B07|nr:probable strigolactone esterase DAD2 [Cornus florida]
MNKTHRHIENQPTTPSLSLSGFFFFFFFSCKMGQSLLEALNVRVIGSGEKILVLAHGVGTDQSAWQRILPYFTPYYRVILYDLICAGSVNPDYFDFRRYTTLDPYVDDLLNILDALGVDRCAYVGHSVSAMIGILASIRRPELFTKLVLIGASPRFLNDRDYHGGFEQGEIEKVFSAMEMNYEAWVKGFAPLAVGADVPTVVREFSRTLFNMRPDITLFVSRTVFNSDLRGVLGLVRVPCCIIQTARDVSVPQSVAAYLKSHLGGRNTVEMLNTEGHLPHLSAPGLLAHVLRRALSR